MFYRPRCHPFADLQSFLEKALHIPLGLILECPYSPDIMIMILV